MATSTTVVDRPEGAYQVLRQGLRASPEVMAGLPLTALMGLAVAAAQTAIPVIIQLAIDRGGLASGNVVLATVFQLVLVGIGVVIGSAVLTWWARRRLVRRAEGALRHLRVRALFGVHGLSIADHDEERTGSLIARVTSDVDVLSRFIDWGLFIWAVQPTVLVAVFVVMGFYSWPLALMALALFVWVVPVLIFMQRRMLDAHVEIREAVSEVFTEYGDALVGAEVVTAYGAQERTRRRLRRASHRRYRAALRANGYMATVYVIGDLFAALMLVTVLTVGFVWREPLGLTAGSFVAVLFLTTLVVTPIAELSETLGEAQQAVAGWRRVLDVADRPADLVEPANGAPLPAGPLAIDVDRVSFSYRGAEPTLRDVSLSIEAGSQVAIVGETGSGKTTFAKLLARLADPSEGTISLGSVPLADVDRESRLASVRLVPQDGFLFDVSVFDNIRLGRVDATATDVAAALDTLGLGRWLSSLPEGIHTRVGKRGEALSVGERQLVAFARAALADPGLLILDEATSSVDPETDRRLTGALEVLAEGRTVVSIAHRLATVVAADVVVVFEGGRIVEVGSHQDLLENGVVYGRLHQAWSTNLADGGDQTTSMQNG